MESWTALDTVPPPPETPLMRLVRILLECILVNLCELFCFEVEFISSLALHCIVRLQAEALAKLYNCQGRKTNYGIWQQAYCLSK